MDGTERINSPPYYSKYDTIILQYNNAHLHLAVPIKAYLETLHWYVLSHPPYSADIAPCDDHFARKMENVVPRVRQCFE